MEWKTNALVLRSTDYGESDKIITLLTAERGKVSAGIKGVKKAGAKLRFAAQPFCFAEYVLAQKGGRNTVISAALHEGFYPIREDVGRYFAAAVVCEACEKLVPEGMESAQLFFAAVGALKEICEGDHAFALVRFLCKALSCAGYPLRAESNCPACAKPLAGRLYFDLSGGAFGCSECAVGVPASESTYACLRAAMYGEGTPSPDGELRALRLLRTYFTYQTDDDLPSVGEYLKIL